MARITCFVEARHQLTHLPTHHSTPQHGPIKSSNLQTPQEELTLRPTFDGAHGPAPPSPAAAAAARAALGPRRESLGNMVRAEGTSEKPNHIISYHMIVSSSFRFTVPSYQILIFLLVFCVRVSNVNRCG